MNNEHHKPIVAVTMGDPSGIGPEITVAALQETSVYEQCIPLVIGAHEVVSRALQLKNIDAELVTANIDLSALGSSNGRKSVSEFFNTEFKPSRRQLFCIDPCDESAGLARPATVDAVGGQAAYDCLIAGASLCRDQLANALVTSPLNKSALHLAGHRWPGHTELLADFCDVKQFAMMLYLPPPNKSDRSRHRGAAGLGVIHATLHTALRNVFQELTIENVYEKIDLAESCFRALRRGMNLPPSPALAVAALNPHGGEDGLFGDEEKTTIAPAVAQAVQNGWNVTGPHPVDTLMPRAVGGEFDAVIAMYHDQGHIALKLLDMFDAVNITLGLPIVRTSVAHGTAFELAWRGTARFSGMVRAIESAAYLSGIND